MSNTNNSDVTTHLSFIQGAIARMGGKSHGIKSLSFTFTAGFIALFFDKESDRIVLGIIAIITVLMFTILNINYLRLSRKYRELYDDVRLGGTRKSICFAGEDTATKIENFDMSVKDYTKRDCAFLFSKRSCFFSWSVWLPLLLQVILISWCFFKKDISDLI